VSDAFHIDSTDLQKFREATREEVRGLFSEFHRDFPNETFYVFGLFDFVDWGCPALFYGASTLEHWKAAPKDSSYSKRKLPDEYFKWAAGDWKLNGNLGSTSIVYDIIAKTGLEEIEDYDVKYEAEHMLRESIEVEMLLALRELDLEGVFGQGDQRNAFLLTVSDEDEGAADDWRHEVSACLLNPDDVFRKFLVEFRRGNGQELPDIDACIEEIRNTDIARRFQERSAS
jgi:hypothetical protein